MTDNTDAMAPVWSSLRALLIAIGGILAANGYGASNLYKMVELGSASVLIVGPAAWGVVTAIQNARNRREVQTTAVNATLKLAASGQMLVKANGDPVPATAATASAIVKSFS